MSEEDVTNSEAEAPAAEATKPAKKKKKKVKGGGLSAILGGGKKAKNSKKVKGTKPSKDKKAPKTKPSKPSKDKKKSKKDKGDKKSKGKKRPRPTGKMSAIEAAAAVLGKSKKPMNAGDLIEAMATKGLWQTSAGKTPDRTLNSAILREIKANGKKSKFKHVGRGLFALRSKSKD